MTQRIIYPADGGGIAVIIPSPDATISIEQIALKDVPEGLPYLIVNVEDVPTDRTFRAAWEADFTNPDGYGIGHDAWFAEQPANPPPPAIPYPPIEWTPL